MALYTCNFILHRQEFYLRAMGCSGSRSVQVESSGSKNGQVDSGDLQDLDKYVTEEEATRQFTEHGLAEERARGLVASLEKNAKGLVRSRAVTQLRERMRELRDQLRPQFASYDQDQSGFITTDDAVQVLSKKMEGLHPSRVQKLVAQYDEDNGQFNYDEFIYFACVMYAQREALEAAFDKMDMNKDGKLGPNGVSAVLHDELGLDSTFARRFAFGFDTDGDSKIDREEFGQVIKAITLQ